MATAAELVDMLDTVTATLRNVLAAHGAAMTEGDRIGRANTVAEAEEMIAATRRTCAAPNGRESAYIAAARKKWCTDDLEIDGTPMVSPGGDPGAWVAAWVWVTDEEAGLEEDDEDEEGED